MSRKASAAVLVSTIGILLGGIVPDCAGDALVFNGAFAGSGMPDGWSPNKPGYWDEAGDVVLTPIPELSTNAVRLTSVSRTMCLYTSAREFAVTGGDRVAMRCLMRGSGAGTLGVYYYPGGGWVKKEFAVSHDWFEFAAELTLPENAKTIRLAISVPPGAATEFLDLRAAFGDAVGIGRAAEQTPLEYPVYPLGQAPTMDGRWDDAVWTDSPAVRGFTSVKTGDLVANRPTAFKMGWHGDSLYIAIRCSEPTPGTIKADPNDYRNGWYQDDNIEFFVAPDRESRPKQFVANSRAARWNNAEVSSGPAAWEARAAMAADHWSLELRIPFDVLGLPGDVKGKTYLFNLCRAAYGNAEKEQWSCFAPVIGGFARVSCFATLRFMAAPVTADVRAQTAKTLDRLGTWQRERLWRAANATEAFLGDRDGDPELAEFRELKRTAAALLASGTFDGAGPLLARYDAIAADFAAPTKKLAFEVSPRDAKDCTLWLNGEQIGPTGATRPVRLGEGLNVVGITMTVDGQAPGLRVQVPGQPELQTRWRVGSASSDAWKAPAFDDRTWTEAATAPDGYLCLPDGLAGTVCFRQVIIWTQHHYGPLPCIQPKVREWGFSEHSMETLFHTLYAPPPLPFPLDDYEFVLDVPKEFRLLGNAGAGDGGGGRLNRRPQSVTAEDVSHDGRQYTRYRLAFESDYVQPEELQCSLIPLVLDRYDGSGRSCTLFFRRLASGNVTELEQTLPVRILPPLNGRMPKKVMISQYCSEPYLRWVGGTLFPAHFERHMSQSLDVGFSHWILSPRGDAYTQKVSERVLARDGKVVLWWMGGGQNYPIWGAPPAFSALAKLMRETPGFRARYFGEPSRTPNAARQFCRSYAVGAGAAQFRQAVQTDIGMMLHGSAENGLPGFPEASIYWTDWEQAPWETNYKPFCFCENCMAAFRKHAGLPENTALSDDVIKAKYSEEWALFRRELDGRVNGIVKEACNELGIRYMLYDGVDRASRRANWPLCKGMVDLAFVGWPGSGQAIGIGAQDGIGTFPVEQRSLDEIMDFMRENVALPRVMGQLFAAGGNNSGKPEQDWPQDAVRGRDGFLNAARLKPQILRIVASFHGGVDLNNAAERCAGQLYYIGEATRAISEFEDLFYDGTRQDDLATSPQVKRPNLLVLTKDGERLVLVFNEGAGPLAAELENKSLRPGQKAAVWGSPGTIASPARMTIAIPPDDVALVHIR